MNKPKIITLATLGEASAQEVFDHVAYHLLTQNAQSLDKDHDCMYRGYNNLMCAAGCLMAYDEYKPEYEHRNWGDLVDYKGFPSSHLDLIMDLQHTHDMFDVIGYTWKEGLAIVANKFSLSTQIFNQFN